MDMIEVTKTEFFAIVGPMNVHPRTARDAAYWETPARRLVGKTTPGWACEGEKSYLIAPEFGPSSCPR